MLNRIVRRSLDVIRLSLAIAGGVVIRHGRRILRRKPRIWHGLSPLFWETYMVQADRIAGYESRILLRDTPQARYQATLIPGVRILGEPEGIRRDEVHWAALRDLFFHADINVAYFDTMYFGGPSVRWANAFMLRLMKLCGIRIIVGAHGGDVTYRARYRSRYDWVGRVQQTNPLWDLVETAPGTIWRIDTYCKIANLVLPNDPTLNRFLPRNDLLFKFFAIDTAALPHSGVFDREIPIVIHAPSSRPNKGTDYIFAALESLRQKGIPFELRLVEKVPRGEALKMYESADVVVDQLCIGAYGTLAIEAMALGKPTLTYLDQEHLGDPVFNMPLINANPENIEPVLAVLLQVPELRRRIGAASRDAIEKFHSIEAMSAIWDRIYRHVWWGEPLDLNGLPHFDPARGTRSFTEDPARADFWPVAAEDLGVKIASALKRAGFGA